MRTVVPFTMEHGCELDITVPLNILYEYTQGPSYTVIVDGKAICAAGVVLQWKGVGMAWAILGESFAQHKIFVTRAIRSTLRDIQRAFSLDRIEAVTFVSVEHMRWLYTLGFTQERRIARKYVNGRDAVRFELIREDKK